MAAFAVVSPLATQVKFGSLFATGTAFRPTNGNLSVAAAAAPPQRLEVTASKRLMGKVVTDTNNKSVTVEVSTIKVYPKYKKRVRTTKNYIVHDPENAAKKGDMVFLGKCAPVSKRKSFVVVEIKKPRVAVLLQEANLPPFESAVASA